MDGTAAMVSGVVQASVTDGEVMLRCVMFFFFSSRRRHTRLQGDWSSDVCSSDLSKHKAYIPLERSALKDEAERLLQLFLKTFAQAPEADFLFKRYYFNLLRSY